MTERIPGFVHNRTGAIITIEDTRRARHSRLVDKARDSKYSWVWQADSDGTLAPFEILPDGAVKWTCIAPSARARRAVKEWQAARAKRLPGGTRP